MTRVTVTWILLVALLAAGLALAVQHTADRRAAASADAPLAADNGFSVRDMFPH